jgi:tetratricopeptide (TPR) repeat protein
MATTGKLTEAEQQAGRDALHAAGEPGASWLARQLEGAPEAVAGWSLEQLRPLLRPQLRHPSDSASPPGAALHRRLLRAYRSGDVPPGAHHALGRLLGLLDAPGAADHAARPPRPAGDEHRLESLRLSAAELALGLQTRAEVAEVAHALLCHVPRADDLAVLLTEMVRRAGAAASPVLHELLLRHDTPEPLRPTVRALAGQLRAGGPPERPRSEPCLEPTVARWGFTIESSGGQLHRLAVGDAKGGPRLRVLVVTAAGNGRGALPAALSVEYHPALSRRQLSRLRMRLAGRGGRAEVAALTELRRALLSDIRDLWHRTVTLPVGYYLGRDLLGIRDEHCTLGDVVRPLEVAAELIPGQDPRELARQLIASGRVDRAVEVLQRTLLSCPFDDELHGLLGLALVERGEHERALAALTRAVELKPDHALHHWNRAAVARRQRRAGRAYLALRSYLQRIDGHRHIPGSSVASVDPRPSNSGCAQGEPALGWMHGHPEADADLDSGARRKRARGFVRDYERLVRREFAGARAVHVALGEELFAHAFVELAAGKLTMAAQSFQTVIARVPTHYPSWGNLGAVYLCQGRRNDAEQCLQRALALNPTYETALRALHELRR